MTNAEIARRRGISVDAVKFHIENAIGKLGLTSRAELKQRHGAPSDSALHGKEKGMNAPFELDRIGQISRDVSDAASRSAARRT